VFNIHMLAPQVNKATKLLAKGICDDPKKIDLAITPMSETHPWVLSLGLSISVTMYL
jgi:hypothetical protein